MSPQVDKNGTKMETICQLHCLGTYFSGQCHIGKCPYLFDRLRILHQSSWPVLEVSRGIDRLTSKIIFLIKDTLGWNFSTLGSPFLYHSVVYNQHSKSYLVLWYFHGKQVTCCGSSSCGILKFYDYVTGFSLHS